VELKADVGQVLVKGIYSHPSFDTTPINDYCRK